MLERALKVAEEVRCDREFGALMQRMQSKLDQLDQDREDQLDEMIALFAEIETVQSKVREKRADAVEAFQAFDEKANQTFELMKSVLEATNEMRMATVRNML